MASFLHSYDRDAGRVNNNGYRCGGKRIRVQVTSVSRRRRGLSRRLGKVQQGRPKKNLLVNKATIKELDKSIMPSRKKYRKKRLHNLNQALLEMRPNGLK